MKAKLQYLLAVLACFAGVHYAGAQGTLFTYQGRLNLNGAPASGNFDFRFKLFPDPAGNLPQVGSTFLANGVSVTGGLFTVGVDFGAGIFTGTNYFLVVGISTNGGASYTDLSPLQPVTTAPYAIMANSASNLLGLLPTSKLNGTVNNGQLANSSVTVTAGTGLSGGGTVALGGSTALTNTGVLSVTGNGDITANTVAGAVTLGSDATNAAIPNTLVKRDATGSFSATNVTINGVITGNGGGLTNLNAAQLTNGQIGVAQLPSVALTNGESGVSISGTNAVAALTVSPKLPGGAVGSLSLGSGASPFSVALAGRYAYVANFASNTLQIIDVSIPSNPVSVGVVPTVGTSPSSVVVAGRHAYVVNRTTGAGLLQIFDVSNPFSPVSVSTVGTGILTAAVAVSGRYVYVLNGSTSGTLQIFDVSNPAIPVLLSTFLPGTQPYALAVSGRYAYVGLSGGGGGLEIIDVSNPAHPVGTTPASIGAPSSIAVSGAYAYMVFGNDSLGIYDISNPALPVSVGSASTGVGPTTVVVAGRYAYVLNFTIFNGNPTTLQIFDVSTPSNPVSMGTVNTGNNPSSLAVSGRYGYVVTENGDNLQVFDLGGAFIQQMEAGTMETGTLQTRDTATVGNNLDVRGGLTVSSSARVSGGLSVDNGNLSGDGGGLTNLNATKLSGALPALSGTSLTGLTAGNLTGALPAISGASLTSLPANAALLNAAQTFSGANTFTNNFAVNTGAGTVTFVNDQGQAAGIVGTGGSNPGDIRLRNYLQIFPNQAGTAAGQLDIRNTGGIGTISATGGDGGIVASNLTANNGLVVDSGNLNTGLNQGAVNAGLLFGSGSGEGMTSIRASGFADSYGLNFYTDFNKRMTILQNGDIGIGTTNATNLLQVLTAYCNGTTWQNGSDRNSKEDFTAIDPLAVLKKVSALPITEWKYKIEAEGTRHLGPVAQDFHDAFGLNGGDDKHISTIDEEGVALAAIQGLDRKVQDKEAAIEDLNQRLTEELQRRDAENAELKQRLDRLEKMLADSRGKH